jgi:formamidopyrimidine-DNA glycosylase
VEAPDAWYLKGGLTDAALAAAVDGRRLTAARRIGKLLLLDTDGPTLGLRFGMTGRLLVDGVPGVEELQHASVRDVPAWDRLVLGFAEGGELRVRDPRRLGGVILDPDEAALGFDAAGVRPAELRDALAGSAAPLKARLMDQARLAGVGNLIADEVLYRAGLDPARPAGSLGAADVRRLHRHLRSTIDDLLSRGGSHLGDLVPARGPGGTCPKDGTPLVRRTVGGRTTWSCPRHQR